jgi:hypothetical protein
MSSPNELTPAEARMLAAFRTMDRRAKGEALLFAELRARDHPEAPPQPTLRLVGKKPAAAGRASKNRRQCVAAVLTLLTTSAGI